MPLEFNKSTDTEHEVSLDSYLISSAWVNARAMAGGQARYRIQTAFVGDGAPVSVRGRSDSGLNLGRQRGVVRGNGFSGVFAIPDEVELGDQIYFEVDVSDNGLSGTSDRIPVVPRVRLFNLQWSEESAVRGQIVRLSAESSGLRDYTDVTVTVYEYDEESGAERILEIPGRVVENRVEVYWEFGYYDDTGMIAGQSELDDYDGRYAYPRYYFTITYEGTEFGTERESGFIEFNDWQEISLVTEDGSPAANERYILHLSDGTQREGSTDSEGYAREEHLPPGPTRIEFPDV